MFDACSGAIAFWLVGYGFAFGLQQKGDFLGSDSGFFAASNFNSDTSTDQYTLWIFQYSFAATATTIVSGSLAERTQLPTYFVFSVLMTAFIYPVVIAWSWGGGWLY